MTSSYSKIPSAVLKNLQDSTKTLKYIRDGISRKEKTSRTRSIIRAIAESVADQDITFDEFQNMVSDYNGMSGASITDTKRSFKNTRKRLEDTRSSKRQKLNPSDETTQSDIPTDIPPNESDMQIESDEPIQDRMTSLENEILETQQRLLDIEQEQTRLDNLERIVNEQQTANDEEIQMMQDTSSTRTELGDFVKTVQDEISARPKKQTVFLDDSIEQPTTSDFIQSLEKEFKERGVQEFSEDQQDILKELHEIMFQSNDSDLLEDVAEPDVSQVVIEDSPVSNPSNDMTQVEDVNVEQQDAAEQPTTTTDTNTLEFQAELSPQELEQVSENAIPLQSEDYAPIDNGEGIVLPGQPIVDNNGETQDNSEQENTASDEQIIEQRDDEMEVAVQENQIEEEYLSLQIVQDYNTAEYIHSILMDDPLYSSTRYKDGLPLTRNIDVMDAETTKEPVVDEEFKSQVEDVEMENPPKQYQSRVGYEESRRNEIVQSRQSKARDIICRPMADDSEVAYRVQVSMQVEPLDPTSLYQIRKGVKLAPVGEQGNVNIHQEINSAMKRYKEYMEQTNKNREAYRSREIEEELARKRELDKWSAIVRLNRDIAEQEEQNKIEYEKRKKMFTRANANKKLIFPSVCDPDTFNVIEYLQDENGDFIMDPETGGPIMSAISSVTRNDARKLSEQNEISKGMLFKKPFYPYFGKACKKFFSNQEFSMLSRFLDKDGKVHKEVVLKSDRQCRIDTIALYSTLQHPLRLPPFPQDYDIRKLYVELRTLNDAYTTYTTIAEYPYSNNAKALKDEQENKDYVESAIKSFERVTMAQLLKRLAESKQELEKESQLHQQMYDVGSKQANANVQSAYPQYGDEGARGELYNDPNQNIEDEDFIVNPLGGRGHRDEDVEYIDGIPFHGGFGGGEWV